ncbi:retrovirus-related pol polyprotein from transposon TNT 1-94 [Tanacetum coccineum]
MYQTFYPEQRIEFYSLNNVSVLPNNMAYSVNSIRRTGNSTDLYGVFQLIEYGVSVNCGSEHEMQTSHREGSKMLTYFHILKIKLKNKSCSTFHVSLTGVARRWLRNQPSGSITTWEVLKTKFLNKYCPPARTAKKMEEINNFQQEPDESLFRAWERFKELLMKCPQHYLTDMQEVILFYNGLDVPTCQILDSKDVVTSKTVASDLK